MACTPCHQIRSDFKTAVRSGQPIKAAQIAAKGLKMMATGKAPSVTRNMGR